MQSVVTYLKEIVIGVAAAGIAATFLAVTQSYWLTLGGVSIPLGLLLGIAFCVALCAYLVERPRVPLFGSMLALLVFLCFYTPLFGLYSGSGNGGGVMLPAALLGKAVWTGYVAQLIGVVVPLGFLGLQLITRRNKKS